MKNLAYPILAFLYLFSCDSEKSNELDKNDLMGKWKLTEAYISAGGPQYWVDVEDGEELEFYEDSTFTSNRYSECTKGVFSIKMEELFLDYSCDGFETVSENEDGLITYILNFESNYVVLTPTSGPICIEGCSYKYQKQ